MFRTQLLVAGAGALTLGAALAWAGDPPILSGRSRDAYDRVAEPALMAHADVRTCRARLNAYYVGTLAESCEVSFSADAPREPTAAETKDFIVKKATWECQPNATKHEISFENDTLVSVATSGILTTTSGNSFTRKVKLQDLNPKRITVKAWIGSDGKPLSDVICLFTTNGDKKVSWVQNSAGKVTTSDEKWFLMEVPEGRTARQIVAGLEYLITLSGGKAELFEDK